MTFWAAAGITICLSEFYEKHSSPFGCPTGEPCLIQILNLYPFNVPVFHGNFFPLLVGSFKHLLAVLAVPPRPEALPFAVLVGSFQLLSVGVQVRIIRIIYVVVDRFELFLAIAAVEGFVDGLFFIDGVLVFLSLIMPVSSMHPRRSRITLSRIRDARWAVIFW